MLCEERQTDARVQCTLFRIWLRDQWRRCISVYICTWFVLHMLHMCSSPAKCSSTNNKLRFAVHDRLTNGLLCTECNRYLGGTAYTTIYALLAKSYAERLKWNMWRRRALRSGIPFIVVCVARLPGETELRCGKLIRVPRSRQYKM